jgi:hypothetical protein
MNDNEGILSTPVSSASHPITETTAAQRGPYEPSRGGFQCSRERSKPGLSGFRRLPGAELDMDLRFGEAGSMRTTRLSEIDIGTAVWSLGD